MDKDPEPARRCVKNERGLSSVQTVFVREALLPAIAEAKSDEASLLEAQLSGGKTALRAIYEALAALAASFGDDVTAAPRKTQVTLACDVTFATVHAAMPSRIDLALQSRAAKATTRSVATEKASRRDPTHILALATEDDVDARVEMWRRVAYDGAAQ